MERLEQIVEDYQKRMAQGASRDEVITSLSAQGFSMIESIKVFRELYEGNLGDAKRIVTSHPIWAKSWESIHDVLIEIVKNGDSDRIPD